MCISVSITGNRQGTNELHLLSVNTTPQDPFNSIKLLQLALGQGHRLWSHLSQTSPSFELSQIQLAFILEDHIQSLVELSSHYPMLSTATDHQTQRTLEQLQKFYHSLELPNSPSKRRSPLCTSICHAPLEHQPNTNYYQPLWDPDDDFPQQLINQDINMIQVNMTDDSAASQALSSSNFLEDTGIPNCQI